MIVIGLRKIEKTKLWKETKSHVVELTEKDLMLLSWTLKRYESPNELQKDHVNELENQFSDMLSDY